MGYRATDYPVVLFRWNSALGFVSNVRVSVAPARFWPAEPWVRPARSRIQYAGLGFVPRALIRPTELWFVPQSPDPSRGVMIRPVGPWYVSRGPDPYRGDPIRPEGS